MLRLTLAQMRRSAGRLAAAGLAIVVGTAFVTATLLAGVLVRDTTYRTVTASMGSADVVVRPADAGLTAADVTALADLDAVAAADGVATVFAQVRAGGRQDVALLSPTASDDRLAGYELLDGTAPAAGEIALTEASAERLGVEIGEEVLLDRDRWAEDGSLTTETVPHTLSGILADPSPLFGSLSTALLDRAALEAWTALPGEVATYDAVLVAGADGTSPADVAAAVSAAVPGAVVRTAEQEAQVRTAELTGDGQALTYLVLAFAAVAMFVAGLVIANTFQVLVAQRRQFLALLRCVGATTAQVHRSVLVEAALLGVLASAAGLVAGLGLGQVALWFVGRANLGLDVASTISVTPAVVVVPLLTGVLVTLLAALAPARAATRVPPVAALRPPQPPALVRGGGRVRFWTAALLVLAGAALLLGGVWLAVGAVDLGLALAVGVLGGIVSFAGVMVGAVYVVPRAVTVLGGLLRLVTGRRGRANVSLATVNATRNPRRTSATASALLIGVALVTMMATGAAGARASLGAMLDTEFPVDLVVTSVAAEPDATLTDAQVEAVRAADGVEQSVPVGGGTVVLAGPDGEALEATLVVVDAGSLAGVVRTPEPFTELADGVVLLGENLAANLGVEDGATLTLGAPGDGEGAPVTAVLWPEGGTTVLATPATAAGLVPAGVNGVWASVADDDPGATVRDVQDALATATGDSGAVPYVAGVAAERAQLEQIIDTLLAVVVGLLGVAVVIALIGVANTLSLSVIERRREHALLRATGMTRGQLRALLASEGVQIALVGALLGSILGLGYGWAATAVVLGGSAEIVLAVPWPYLGAAVVVALVAGLAASVLPARSAVRTPPVVALAAE